jgi:protein TonB
MEGQALTRRLAIIAAVLLSLAASCKEKMIENSEDNHRPKEKEQPLEVRGNEYMTKIYTKVKSKYSLPDQIPESERWGLKATVIMRLKPTGEIKSIELEQSSGNKLFDEATMKAVRTAAPFGAPPEELADRYETEGIGIEFDGR